jgi:hypothetical protein
MTSKEWKKERKEFWHHKAADIFFFFRQQGEISKATRVCSGTAEKRVKWVD